MIFGQRTVLKVETLLPTHGVSQPQMIVAEPTLA